MVKCTGDRSPTTPSAEDPRYAMGTFYDVEMREFNAKWRRWLGRRTLDCGTECNPCDFRAVEIRSLGQPAGLQAVS